MDKYYLKEGDEVYCTGVYLVYCSEGFKVFCIDSDSFFDGELVYDVGDKPYINTL